VGVNPPTCPWRTIHDPLVAQVRTVYNAREHHHQVALVGGSWEEAPRALVVGLHIFDAAYQRTLEHFREKRRAERKKEAEASRKASTRGT
jgi:hypothetical protein